MKAPISAFAGSPPALGPYSLGVVAEGKFVFVSGMTPYDPDAGKIDRGTIARQTELVIENIRNVLAQAGATLEDVVSCRVYLADLTPENFQEMNAVYARYFDAAKPARATIGAQLPPGFDVEIECIAVLPAGQ
jgi:2-iminobutanoate/2-iminopropanoate deaminase